jgi:hypothetical protein
MDFTLLESAAEISTHDLFTDQIQQPPIFLGRPLASTMPGHVATLFLPA